MESLKKTIMAIFIGSSLIACAQTKDSPPPPPPPTCAYVPGQVSTAAGSSIGASNYAFTVGNGTVYFSNLNLTFYVTFGNVIVDVGNLCLADADFWTGDTVSGSITVFIGHTYLVRSRVIYNGVTTYSYSRFVVTSYRDGVLNLTYAQH